MENVINEIEEVTKKLKAINLYEVVLDYCKKTSLLSVDYEDFKQIICNNEIVNYFYGSINLNEPIKFNFKKYDSSNMILVIETNASLHLNVIEKISDELKNSVGNSNIIYGLIVNDSLEDDILKALIINTYGN